MGDKLATASKEANQLLLIPVADSKTSHKVVWSWAMRMFMTGCLILLLIAIPFYITRRVMHFMDALFSQIYTRLGIDDFGVGFVTSAAFVFLVVTLSRSPDQAKATAIKARKPENRSYKEISYPEIPSLPLHITLEKQFENEKISGQGENCLIKREESNIEHIVTFINSRKPVENGIVKSKTVSRSPDQAKVTAIKARKPENRSYKAKSCPEIPSLPLHITLEKQFENEKISGQGERSPTKREESNIEHTTTKLTEICVQDTKMMLQKLQGKEDPPSATIDCKEGALNSGKTSRKTEAKESPIKRLSKGGGASKSKRVAEKQKGVNKMNDYGHASHPSQTEAIHKKADKTLKEAIEMEIVRSKNGSNLTEKGVQNTKMMLKELQVKEELVSTTINCKEGALKSGKKSRKTDARESPIRSLSKGGGGKERKKAAEKLEQKEAVIKQESSDKLNGHATHQPQKEAMDKKDDKTLKVAVTSRKSTEKENEKSGSALRSQDQAKVTARKVKKPVNGLYFTRNHTSSSRKRSLTKRAKPVSQHISAKFTNEDEECEENDNRVNFRCKKKDSILAFDDDALADQLPELKEIYTFQIGEHLNDSQISPCATSWISDFIVTNERLSVDCANELIFPYSKVVHPHSLSCLRNPILCNALHQLLEEVDEAVETLRSRSKLSVYKMLEREIGCNIVDGIWDLGWRYDCSLVDIEKAVSDLEKLVLTTKEGGTKEREKVVEKLEQKEAVIKQKGFNKLNASGHATYQPQKEAIDKKDDKTLKVAVTSRKSTEKEIVKSGSASRSQDQAKVTERKVKKPVNGLYSTRNHTSSSRKRSLTKRAKPVSQHISAKFTTEGEECEENDKSVNFRCKKKDSILAFDDDALADQLPELEEIYTFQIEEHLNDGQSSPCVTSWFSDFILANERLSVDCANELIFPDSKVVHPQSLSCLRNLILCNA